MAENKKRRGPATSQDIVFSTTDYVGREMYLTEKTIETHWYHGEIMDFKGHEDALKDPRIVAYHTEDTDKRIYLGKPWELEDLSLGSRYRMLVVVLSDTGSRGQIITAYNKSGVDRLPDSVGKIIFDGT